GAAAVIADLRVDVTTDPRHPAVAQAPAEGVVGVQFFTGLVVGVVVLEVVVVHQTHVGIEAVRIHVGDGQHALHGVVVVAQVDDVVLVVAAGGQDEVDTGGDVQLVAQVITQYRTQVGVADPALVVMRAVLDVQAHVVERQQGVKAQLATQYLLLGDPDEARHDGGDAQVDIGRLVAGIVAHAIGQVVADEYLPVGAGRGQDAHAVEFDTHRPGGQAAFGGVGDGRACAQQQAGGQSKGSGVERVLLHGKANLVVIERQPG